MDPRADIPDETLPSDLVALRDQISGHGGVLGPAGAARLIGCTTAELLHRHLKGGLPEPIAWDDQMTPHWLASQLTLIPR